MSIVLDIKEKFESLDISQALKRAYIDYGMKVEKNPAIIKITRHHESIDIFTQGNFSVTAGKAKARKSFALSMFMASAIKSSFYGCIEACTFGKNNLLFDTEQGKYHTFLYNRRAIKIAGFDRQPDNFKTYFLRPFGHHERVDLIDHILENTKDIGFVIIDGARDLVSDINNANECTDIVNKLMYWTEKYNCHINVVLHFNPNGDLKLRGHLGTEITNKAETAIKVEKCDKNGKYSIISPLETRGRDFTPFAFYINNYEPIIDYDYEFKDKCVF